MKKGFVLLETLIAVSLVSISLLLLYNSFISIVRNNEKNLYYDDVSDIYKVFYIKEFIDINKYNLNKEIINIKCDNKNCSSLVEEFLINNIYLVKYDLKDYEKQDYSTSFNDYVASLSNKEDYKYRLIVEFKGDNNYSYASIGVKNHE